MELPSSPEFIISCEHAGNEIPENYLSLFAGAEEILNSHRGWDPGALELAQILAEKTETKLFFYPFTRLLIEPNRSLGHPKLFSEFSRPLKKSARHSLIESFYQPYRNRVTDTIKKNASTGIPTIHISVHSFTPIFNEEERNFEFGLLYDPKRIQEKNVCQHWKSILKQTFPEYKIRMNRPYKGASDGLTTYLRKVVSETLYLGIELEVNQKLFIENCIKWDQTCVKIAKSLSLLSNRLPID